MTTLPHILFCESPIESNKVDPDFEGEFLAAKQTGLTTMIFNFDDLTNPGRTTLSTKKMKPADQMTNVIYRGWMLTPKQYAALYDELSAKNYKLVNTVEEYKNCHFLPDSLKFIGEKTPGTIFEKLENDQSIERLIEKASVFGSKPVIIKDYVKSEKHDWETACFVDNASNNQTQANHS